MRKYIVVIVMMLASGCKHQPLQQFNSSSMQEGDYAVFFAADSDVLDAASQQTLRAVAHVVTRNTPKKILINGNADRSGSLQHNKQLAMKRAEAVAKFLENRGVNRNIMDVRSYGASAAWTDNAVDDADEHYRTVRIVLLKFNKIEYR